MSQQTPLIKPQQIDGLPFLSAEQKQQYKNGLAGLWQSYETSPVGSPQRQDAENKIRQASTKLMQQLQRSRPNSGGQQSQQQPQQQQQSRPNQLPPGANQAQAGQQGNAAQFAQAQAQAQAQVQTQGGQPGAQQGQRGLSAASLQELNSVNVVPPPDMAPQNHETFRQNFYRSAQEALLKRDKLIDMGRQTQAQITGFKTRNQPVPEQYTAQLNSVKAAVQKQDAAWKILKNSVEQNAQRGGAGQGGQQAQAMSGNQGQNIHRPGTQPSVSAQSQQDIKTNEQRPSSSSSPQQTQNGFAQSQNQRPTPTQNGSQNMAMQQNPNAQMGTQQSGQPFSQNNMQQPPRPPPINTQQAPGQVGQQSAQQPGSAMSNAGNQNMQRPQALTHQAAMSQAAESYSRSQQQAQQAAAQPQQAPNGMPFNNQPNSATQQNTPTSAYPNLQSTQQTSSATHKFPIPKNLTLDPRTQQPVAGPPSRPTLSSQGMMYNPGIHRQPTYTLEGEGDRVLSKRKLDELVRQVTGAAPSSDGGDSAVVLAPEVEESIMQVADNFVDDVIASACRLAKLRPNQTLDIRDIQIVLERNYGIRIPGYSLDEVRTVRKFQPAPGWQSKMQAVQAGKVMGNREA